MNGRTLVNAYLRGEGYIHLHGGIGPRMRQLQEADPSSAGEAVAEVGGFPPGLSWEHFERAREEAVFALVEEESSEIERLLGDLRRVVTRFDDLSQRAHYRGRGASAGSCHSPRRQQRTPGAERGAT